MSVSIDRIESDVTLADPDGSSPAPEDLLALVLEELERRRRQAEGDALLEQAIQLRRRTALSWS